VLVSTDPNAIRRTKYCDKVFLSVWLIHRYGYILYCCPRIFTVSMQSLAAANCELFYRLRKPVACRAGIQKRHSSLQRFIRNDLLLLLLNEHSALRNASISLRLFRFVSYIDWVNQLGQPASKAGRAKMQSPLSRCMYRTYNLRSWRSYPSKPSSEF
jgi:hypothetical protein